MSAQFTRKHVPSCLASLAHAISIYAYHAGTHVHKFIHTYACTLLRIYKHADAQTQGLVQTRTYARLRARTSVRAGGHNYARFARYFMHARTKGRTDGRAHRRTCRRTRVCHTYARAYARPHRSRQLRAYTRVRAHASAGARSFGHIYTHTHTRVRTRTHPLTHVRTRAHT